MDNEKATDQGEKVQKEEPSPRRSRFVWSEEDLAGIKIIKKADKNEQAKQEPKDEKTDATSKE